MQKNLIALALFASVLTACSATTEPESGIVWADVPFDENAPVMAESPYIESEQTPIMVEEALPQVEVITPTTEEMALVEQITDNEIVVNVPAQENKAKTEPKTEEIEQPLPAQEENAEMEDMDAEPASQKELDAAQIIEELNAKPVEEKPQAVDQSQKKKPTKTPLTFSTRKTYMNECAKTIKDELQNARFSVVQKENKIILTLPNSILFGTNQATLEPQVEPFLTVLSRILKEYDATKIQIFAYTDNQGTVSDLKALSLRRANAVFNLLRLNGLDINRIVVDGLGPANPKSLNKTAKGRAQNNRVEITLINMQ